MDEKKTDEKKTEKRWRILWKWPPFLIGFVLLIQAAGVFFQPFWISFNAQNFDTPRAFYEKPSNTLEVAFLGSSAMENGIDPMVLYKDHGICAFNFGTSVQPMLVSYYWLEEAYRLHKDSLKAVVLETTQMDKQPEEARYHMGIDYMKFSDVKMRAISDYTNGSLTDIITNTIPLFSYHDRWNGLGKEDFSKLGRRLNTSIRGYHYDARRDEFRDNTYENLFTTPYLIGAEMNGEEQLNEESMYYLGKMIDFCKDKGLKLVLMKTPVCRSAYVRHNSVQAFADQYGLDFFDFNFDPLFTEVGYNYAADMADFGHVNYYGANKLSRWMGEYLSDHCGIRDIRGEKAYAFMEDELKDFQRQVLDIADLNRMKDAAEYLSFITKKENYKILLAVKDDASRNMTDEQRKKFSQLGLPKLAGLGFRDSYLAVIDTGKGIEEYTEKDPGEEVHNEPIHNTAEGLSLEKIKEQRSVISENRELTLKGNFEDGTPYILVSGGHNLGNRSSCKIENIERMGNSKGLCIVVYDKISKLVVNVRTFDLNASPTSVSSDIAAALAEALDRDPNYRSLPSELKKLYYYNVKCEDARKIALLKQTQNTNGILGYLKEFGGNKDYAVFISVKDDAAEKLSGPVRSFLTDFGLKELAAIEPGDSYYAII